MRLCPSFADGTVPSRCHQHLAVLEKRLQKGISIEQYLSQIASSQQQFNQLPTTTLQSLLCLSVFSSEQQSFTSNQPTNFQSLKPSTKTTNQSKCSSPLPSLPSSPPLAWLLPTTSALPLLRMSLAVPTPSSSRSSPMAAASLVSHYLSILLTATSHLTNTSDCVIALAPSSATCAAAAAELELNPIADAACFASILNNMANPPAACSGC